MLHHTPPTPTPHPLHPQPDDPVKEQIAQDKFGKSYDEITAHQRVQVGGTKVRSAGAPPEAS